MLLALALCTMMCACSKDEPAKRTQQPSTPSQTENEKVTDEDVFNYFSLDKTLTVWQAAAMLKTDNGTKTINGKQINITSVSEVSRDEHTGKITVSVAGKIGEKPFARTVSFEGFVQKPADVAMAKRVQAVWKSDVNVLKTFDFDTLYRLQNTDKYTTAYLSQFVQLLSSTPDGVHHYTFSPEDLARTTISDVRYVSGGSTGRLTFTVTYNGIQGNTGSGVNAAPSLPFDKNEYYNELIQVNNAAAGKIYMRGAYEYLDVFYGNMLQYNSGLFAPRLVHKQKNDSENSLSMTIQLLANDGSERELARFTKTITGFKPLSDLSKELLLASSEEVGKQLGKRFRNTADGDKLAQMQAVPVQTWIKKAQMSLKRDGNLIELSPSEVSTGNGHSIVTVWKPTSTSGSVLDIYLESPIFEVVEAKKEGVFLHLKLKLKAVNETVVEGETISLSVHLLNP